jgi:polyisoprenoid-binding protein YceI
MKVLPIASLLAFGAASLLVPVDRLAVGAEPASAQDPAALEGGNPVPDGAMKAEFGDMPKQSITFTSDAPAERMVGIVAFGAGSEHMGTAETDGKGGGSFSFRVPVASLTTGNKSRDEHMVSANWLDGAKHPEVTFVSKKVERVRPTVWRVTGTWTMHGVSKDLTLLANVRHIGKVERVGDSVIRVRATVPLDLAEFGVTNPYVGSAAVAKTWDVSVDLLGVVRGGTAPAGGAR